MQSSKDSGIEQKISRELKAVEDKIIEVKDPNRAIKELRTFGEKFSDKTTRIIGSWTFITLFLIFFFFWICANVYGWLQNWDPYPFILLNLTLSALAAIQAPIILMSQNRHSTKDRIRAEIDYHVNLKAEREIKELQGKVDELKNIVTKSKASVLLIVLLIALGIIVAGGGGYLIWHWQKQKKQTQNSQNQSQSDQSSRSPSQSSETDSWPVYTNDTHNYKIKYPATWYVHKTGYSPPPPTAIAFASVPEGQVQGNYARMEISALPAMGETLNENAEIQSLVADGYTKSSMTLSDQPAIKLGNEGHPENGGAIYCVYQNKIYRLNFGATTKALFLAHQDTFSKMIDTFAFIGESGGREITVGSTPLGDTASIQQSVDQGHQPWRLNPVEVARADGVQYGFSSSDTFNLISQGFAENVGTYLATVDAVHNNTHYTIQLIQPETQGSGGIWAINSIFASM